MTWAIGDIQGCYDSFIKLLQKIEFNPAKDKLWLVGDLVNRGPKSLEVLEYLYSIKDSIYITLGNHDISLIASYYGLKKPNPTIAPIIDSPKAKELIDWLKSQPFVHIDKELGFAMAHAGISPQFTLKDAKEFSDILSAKLNGDKPKKWLKKMFAKDIDYFSQELEPIDKQRYALASFTRMRYCYSNSKLDFSQKGPLSSVNNKELLPWYECPNRKSLEIKVVFGHWSTLGFTNNNKILAIDTGCLWGRELTAVNLENQRVVNLSCK
jgi:bis(5'-nucleosyl)-tetraphosphatase (symmetrical)